MPSFLCYIPHSCCYNKPKEMYAPFLTPLEVFVILYDKNNAKIRENLTFLGGRGRLMDCIYQTNSGTSVPFPYISTKDPIKLSER